MHISGRTANFGLSGYNIVLSSRDLLKIIRYPGKRVQRQLLPWADANVEVSKLKTQRGTALPGHTSRLNADLVFASVGQEDPPRNNISSFPSLSKPLCSPLPLFGNCCGLHSAFAALKTCNNSGKVKLRKLESGNNS